MSPPRRDAARRVVFVSPRPAGESLRCARAVGRLEGVRLLGVCQQPPNAHGAEVFAGHIRVEDAHDADQLIAAARTLAAEHGPLEMIVTAQETLLEPVARATEALGLRGLTVATVRRALDKSLLKQALARAGVGTARDRLLTSEEDARRFVADVGFPFVLKPTGGSGGLETLCVRDAGQLELALRLARPSPARAVLAEVYLRGQELCIDTITIKGEPRFHSVCCYRPSILEALEDERVQWTCVMPRDIECERYREFVAQGLEAVRALSVGDAMTHMEGFMLEGGGLCFTDATLRPAGARIGPMLGFAYDIDPRFAWARAAVDGSFDGPWERRYAVGTIFLRGAGGGTVERVDGLDTVRREVGGLLVESRLPRAGSPKSPTYTGDGYVTLRHPETRVVEDALRLISETVRVVYGEPGRPGPPRADAREWWTQPPRHSDERPNKPAWDDDSLPGLDDA